MAGCGKLALLIIHKGCVLIELWSVILLVWSARMLNILTTNLKKILFGIRRKRKEQQNEEQRFNPDCGKLEPDAFDADGDLTINSWELFKADELASEDE